MNAVAEQVTEQLTIDSALAQVQAAVAQLRTVEGEHLSDQAALTRGRERLAAAASEVARINDENAAAVERHARRLTEQARSGAGASSVPSLVPSEKHLMAEITAQRTHAAAVAMMQALQSAVDASAGRARAERLQVDSALQALRAAEVHHYIHDGLELLDEFETTYAEIHARTESRGDSKFGNEIDDPEPSHMRMRSVWDCLQRQRMGPTSQRGVLEPQPPLVKARAALAARDAQLTNPTSEQT